MSGFSGGGVVPPAGDLGGTTLLPRVREIGGIPVTLLGGAVSDVLTQQGDGSYKPAPGGGGGGGLPGFFGIGASPDLGGGGAGEFYVPLFGSQTFGPSGTVTNVPIFPDNGNYGSFGINCFATSFWTFTGPGLGVLMLPEFFAPTFTSPGGHKIVVDYVIWASDLAFDNFGIWQVKPANRPAMDSFTTYQVLATDLQVLPGSPVGTDLSIGTSSAADGDGIITAAGAVPYLCGISGMIETNADMTFP